MKKHITHQTKREIAFCIIVSLSIFFIFQSALAANLCGDAYNTGHVGPWDYADPFNHSAGSVGAGSSDSRVLLVEKPHFPPIVERLQGFKHGSIMRSLNYTLGVFPNHHRALWTLIKYDKKLDGKLPKLSYTEYPVTVECYFNRAFQFRPKDPKVHQLYGSYFHLNQKYNKALDEYLIAEKLSNNNPELTYNMGLLFYDMKNYVKAKDYAEKAIKSGFPLKALKEKLIKNGNW